MSANDYKPFRCGFDEALGWPEDGIAAGTRWDDIPDDWSCPDCGAAKSISRWWYCSEQSSYCRAQKRIPYAEARGPRCGIRVLMRCGICR